MEQDYKLYVGSIFYAATCEGHHWWVYIAFSDSEEEFKKQMQKSLEIDDYFMIGLQFDNKNILEKYKEEIEIIRNACWGEYKMYYGYNYS